MTAFEQWYSDEGANPKAVERNTGGDLLFMHAILSEIAWQAALEHAAKICDELATTHKRDTGCCTNDCDFVMAFETCAETIREEISK